MPTKNIPVSEIIKELEIYDGTYKRSFVNAAIERRAEIIPLLIGILEKVLANCETFAEDYNYMGHTYALMLLGYFREPKAHPVIVALASLPGELPFDLFGDLITEDLPAVLFHTSHGEMDQIKTLVKNQEANPYCRNAAVRALVFAVAEGVIPRLEAIRFLGPVFADEMAVPDSEFITLLSDAIHDLNPIELIDPVRLAYQQGLIDPRYIGDFEEFSKALDKPIELCLEKQRLELERRSSADFHSRIEWWAMFDQPSKTSAAKAKPEKAKRRKRRKK